MKTLKKVAALLLATLFAVTLLAGCGGGGKEEPSGSGSAAPAGGTIKIGYVNPTTGALAGNGEGCEWVVKQIENFVNNEMGGIEVDGAKKNIKVIVYDSQSNQQTAADMAEKLCVEDEVDLIIAIQTPETAIPVEVQAEKYEVPCIGIQAPVDPCAGALHDAGSADWTVHAFWTIDNIYEAHKALWTAAGYGPGSGAKIGLAFANDADGTAWHDTFVKKLPEDGYVVVDPDQYPSGTDDFSNVVKAFKDADIDILAGTNIPPDFSNLFTQMQAAGVQVDAITMGKCCLLPGDVAALGDNVEGILSEVWWAPEYPYVSELTGIDCPTLGANYQKDNGGVMPQPAGYAYASLELAVEAFQKAGTTDKAKVFEALKSLDVETIVGPIKYDKQMLELTYSDTVVAGGQWQKGDDGEWHLVVIDASLYPELQGAVAGEYKPGNATQK